MQRAVKSAHFFAFFAIFAIQFLVKKRQGGQTSILLKNRSKTASSEYRHKTQTTR
jgi:Flp pilus assembly protein TadB